MEYTLIIILILILGLLFTKRLNYKSKKANQLIVDNSTILDVRSVLEFNRGHFKNSINIPLDLLSKNIDILIRNLIKILLKTAPCRKCENIHILILNLITI